jgi:hypothetical protein
VAYDYLKICYKAGASSAPLLVTFDIGVSPQVIGTSCCLIAGFIVARSMPFSYALCRFLITIPSHHHWGLLSDITLETWARRF